MKKIRIGKDISLRWEITTDGMAIPLEGRDLMVEIKSPMSVVSNIPFRVDGNTIIMTYYGTEQKSVGEHSVTLWENKGKPGQNVVDSVKAFKLVKTSQEEDDFANGDIQVESVDLGTANFSVLTEGGYRAINIDTLQAEVLEDAVNINGKTYGNEPFTITLPKANLDKAGVMSSADVRTLQEHGNSIFQMKTSLQGHQSAIDSINTTLGRHDESISQINSTLQEHTESIASNKTSCEENAAEIERVSNVVDSHESRLGNIDTTLSSHTASINSINNTLVSHATQINDATENIESTKSALSTLQGKVDANTTSISQINTELNNKDNEIAQINTKLEEHTEIINANITTDRIADGAVTTGKLEPSIQSLITNISKNASFAGIATPTTNPCTPDGPVFYLASSNGIYYNFDGLEVLKGESAILKWNNGTWVKNTFKPMTDFDSVFNAEGRSLTELELTVNVIRPDMLPSFNKIDPDRLIIGKYITNNGDIIGNPESWMSEFIDVLGLEKVYSMGHNVGVKIYAYDTDFNFISAVSNTGNEYTLVENARYIRLSGPVKYIASPHTYLYTEEETKKYAYGITKGMIYADKQDAIINGTIDDLRTEVRTIETNNQYINKINYVTDWIDGYVLVNGNMAASDKGCVTNFIDVLGLEKVYSNVYANGYVIGYDKDKNYVKGLSGGISIIEEGIRYIRLTYNNKDNKAGVFLYTNADYVNLSFVAYSTKYAYGITYSDVEQGKLAEQVLEKLDKFHTAYINSINQFTTDIVEKENAGFNVNGEIINNTGRFYSKYIPVVSGQIISSNIQTNGGMFAYDKNKKLIGLITGWKYDSTFENYIGTNVVPDNCAFIRVSGLMSGYSTHVLYVGNEVVYKKYDFGETFDAHFKYRNKKLVTIGDSITYQTSWQRRLCELTGMRWNRKEVRGADESIRTEGYGYILLSAELEDTDTYFEAVDGIEKTEETIVDGFGYAHPIWTDAEGNKYRQPCRMAEGGETVMPVRTTSIYSRASDSKYYKGDVIIVFAGANDKVGYINKYPTYGNLSNIQGVTNLKTDSEDTTESTFEIYTDDRILEAVGDYSDVGEITGVQKYNYTFRACFRGLLKKVVDANPDAEIIVVGPFATMIKGNEYISRVYDYLTKVSNEVIAECAREFSCQYIDLMPLFGRYNADKYFSKTDGTVYVHPTTDGGKKIAEYIASMIM